MGSIVGGQRRNLIAKTTDGGFTWDTLPLGISYTLSMNDLHFPTSNIGYAVGIASNPNPHTVFLKTINAGATWSSQVISGRFVSRMHFENADTGYLTADSGYILKTNDGGATWLFTQMFSTFQGIRDIHCPQAGTCYVAGNENNAGFVFKTSDGGTNWVRCTFNGNPAFSDTFPSFGIAPTNLNSIFFSSTNTGYLAGNANVFNTAGYYANRWLVYKTMDGGTSWNISYHGPIFAGNGSAANLYTIYCINTNTCYAVGNTASNGLPGANLLRTYDGGSTWTEQILGLGERLSSVHFPTPTVGYIASNIAGNSGVWKTDPLVPIYSAKPSFNRFDITDGHLLYHLPIPAKVQILLFDLGGRQTLKLFDGTQTAGEHALTLPLTTSLQVLDFRAGENRRAVKVLPR